MGSGSSATVPHSRECGRSAVLERFTRRLKRRVAASVELTAWLIRKEVQRPLAPGLLESHYKRWSLLIQHPASGEPRGWYDDFFTRWRLFLATLTRGLGTVETGPVAGVVQDLAASLLEEEPTHSEKLAAPTAKRRRVSSQVAVAASARSTFSVVPRLRALRTSRPSARQNPDFLAAQPKGDMPSGGSVSAVAKRTSARVRLWEDFIPKNHPKYSPITPQ